MFVLITGGGRTATYLANLLLKENHTVHLIEHRLEVLARIHRELPTESVYQGSATDPEVLEQAGIGNAQIVAACTVEDADNLAICYLARTRYGVPRTIARINNPLNAWLFQDLFHVDVSLNQAEIMASLIEEEMSMGDMMTLLKLRRGQYSLVEEKLPPGARAVGVAIKDLSLPENTVISVILRHGEIILPKGSTVLEAGDEVLAVVDTLAADRLAELFFAPPPGRQPAGEGESRLTNPSP